MIDLEPMSYDDWKKARQSYLDSRTASQKLLDIQYQQYFRTGTNYDLLSERIRQRQQLATPIAGEGLIQFLEASGKLASGVGTLLPVGRKIAAIITGTKEIVEERLT